MPQRVQHQDRADHIGIGPEQQHLGEAEMKQRGEQPDRHADQQRRHQPVEHIAQRIHPLGGERPQCGSGMMHFVQLPQDRHEMLQIMRQVIGEINNGEDCHRAEQHSEVVGRNHRVMRRQPAERTRSVSSTTTLMLTKS